MMSKVFDHEKLHVYQAPIELQQTVWELLPRPESSSCKIGNSSYLCNSNRITIKEWRVTKENKQFHLEARLIDFAVRIIFVASVKTAKQNKSKNS